MKGDIMKKIAGFIMACLLLGGNLYADDKALLTTEKEKVSYSMGVDIGKRLKQQSIDFDPDLFAKGLKDVYGGGETLLTDQEIKETLTTFQKTLIAKQTEMRKQQGEKNKSEGDAFLAGNKKKGGVITLPSGLQYTVIEEGTGKTPKATDTVVTNYRGTLIDGTEFDSSYKRGKPATFPVNGVIKGWTEALQLMKEGAKWKLFIPSDLAYGERGAGNSIGPNATLIFDIELISVKEEAKTKE
jgi:FKBP-type peptidyl-prolyl cis-trans isomerase FklB